MQQGAWAPPSRRHGWWVRHSLDKELGPEEETVVRGCLGRAFVQGLRDSLDFPKGKVRKGKGLQVRRDWAVGLQAPWTAQNLWKPQVPSDDTRRKVLENGRGSVP